jgi:hypothetical protein
MFFARRSSKDSYFIYQWHSGKDDGEERMTVREWMTVRARRARKIL